MKHEIFADSSKAKAAVALACAAILPILGSCASNSSSPIAPIVAPMRTPGSPTPSTTPSATPIPSTPSPIPSTPSPTPTPGGAIVIIVPSPAPILCVANPVTLHVGASAQITCSAQGYIGNFTWTVANPAVATVTQFNDEDPTLFTVTGVSAGSTSVSFKDQPGATGSETITVLP